MHTVVPSPDGHELQRDSSAAVDQGKAQRALKIEFTRLRRAPFQQRGALASQGGGRSASAQAGVDANGQFRPPYGVVQQCDELIALR